jgi:hypothetical protein
LEILDEDGKIILKWILKKQDVGVWTDSFNRGHKPVAGSLNAEMKSCVEDLSLLESAVMWIGKITGFRRSFLPPSLVSMRPKIFGPNGL